MLKKLKIKYLLAFVLAAIATLSISMFGASWSSAQSPTQVDIQTQVKPPKESPANPVDQMLNQLA